MLNKNNINLSNITDQLSNLKRKSFILNISEDLLPLIEMVPGVMFSVNEEGNIQYMNKKFLDLINFDISEVLGKPFFDYIWNLDANHSVNEFKKLSDKNVSPPYINHYVRKGGTQLVRIKWEIGKFLPKSKYFVAFGQLLETIPKDDQDKSQKFYSGIE